MPWKENTTHMHYTPRQTAAHHSHTERREERAEVLRVGAAVSHRKHKMLKTVMNKESANTG